MSLGEDYLNDYAFEMMYPFGIPDGSKDPVWTTAKGEMLRLAEMTESHIRNCMRLVGEDDDWFSAFSEELKKRGIKI